MDTNRAMKNRFLVVYDYGQGGVWMFIYARTSNEIIGKFPDWKKRIFQNGAPEKREKAK